MQIQDKQEDVNKKTNLEQDCWTCAPLKGFDVSKLLTFYVDDHIAYKL